MIINPLIYRGYDIRAIIGQDLDEEGVYAIAKGYATFLRQREVNEAVVGHDWRLSSPKLSQVFIKGLTESGVNVYNIGMALTQMGYFAQYELKCVGCAIITASHNSKEFNGIKLSVGFSDTMVTKEIQDFRKIVEEKEFVRMAKKGRVKNVDIFPAYTKDLLKRVDLKKKLKVVVDAGNGTAGAFMPHILRLAGCKVIEQNCRVDGNFPSGTPDPTDVLVAKRLAKRALSERADVGLSYDGDGDRVGFVDERGGIIWNDAIVSLLAKDILERNPGAKIVFNALCSRQVPEVIRMAGGIPIMWLVGHSFIKAKVREERALFGGELSGHFFFMDNYYGHDDGAYSTLRMLKFVSGSGRTLSLLVDELPQYISSPEIKVGCPDERKWELVKEIKEAMREEFTELEANELEGVRMEGGNTMVVMRASQNGPYLTIRFEAKTKNRYENIKNRLSRILRAFRELDFEHAVNIDSLR